MFIGHTAIALAAKRARPSVPIGALIAAAYGPDVIEITLLALWRWARVQATFGSHSIPSITLGAAVAAVAYWIWRRDVTGAALLAATYASHWAADLFTGTGKPTWGAGPTLGLSLYEHPLLDFALESALLLVAWRLFWPAGDRRSRARAVQMAAVALVLMQLAFNASERLFGVSSIKDAVSSARRQGNALSAAIGRTIWSAQQTQPTAPLAACLLHRLRRPSSHELSMADNTGPRGVVTLVCLTCGKERFYEQTAPPPHVTCEQCGGSVFRQFATPTEPDEAAIVTLEEQARSIAYGDASPDTSVDDVRDLEGR